MEEENSLMEKLAKGEAKAFFQFPKIGELVKGRVISKKASAVFVDLGISGTGIIYGRELQESSGLLKDIKEGEEILTKIIGLKNEQGYFELSLREAEAEKLWDSFKEKKEKRETVSVKISGANQGGLTTDISGIPAFLPLSQLSKEHYPQVQGDRTKILESLKDLIGKDLKVIIINLNPGEKNLIISEKG